MTVPQPSFGPLGFVAPDEADILVAVKAEINAAFDNELNMADETPQGQIAVSQTAAIGNANDSFVFLSQQFDPAYNSGRYQDAIARIYFLSRQGAQPTAVICTCGGLNGVTIPAGSFAVDAANNLYQSTADAIIGAGGVVSVTFQNTIPGPTPCPAGTLTTIYQSINGWDSITNPGDGVLGNNTETPAEFEARRFASVAKNSISQLSSIRSNVLEIPGVLDCYVTENVNDTPTSIGGVTLGPKSMLVVVVGGDDNLIAQTIWRKKSPGCGYNGNTSVIVLDSNVGYEPPYPAYAVSFERPTSLSILFLVNIQANPSIPANAVDLIQQSIISAFAGEDGGTRAVVGAELFAARYYGAVTSLGPWAQLRNIKIGSIQLPDAVATGSVSGTSMTITAIASGTILVGGTVEGSQIPSGSRILSQSSGTPGGLGVYVLNNTFTAVSTTLTMASPTLETMTPNLNFEPTIAASDIQVVIS
jgi:hypothetical protein